MKLNFNEKVDLTIGAGGRAMYQLLNQLILQEFDNEYLAQQSDQAILPPLDGKLAFSTDSYVVSPLFFNGGDIGSLAINGTVNDLAVAGATPLYISVGLIIEEGFPLADLRTIIQSMAQAARNAKVKIVTGDTKVVEQGKGDGIFINTSGIGVIADGINLNSSLQVGDKIIINGSIADHGMAILSKRQGLDFASNICSDCASLHDLIAHTLQIKPQIRCMRDPTRGGLSATLNEWAHFYKIGINLHEQQIIVEDNVRGLCELLGLDPLHIANEGKVLLICAEADAHQVVAQMRQHPLGKQASIIGEITSLDDSQVTMTTTFGGKRRVDWLSGEQLPRIC
ncbi:MAG: hydrogenase expression/formation protein HypE [Pseudomonadota bacterium]|jgi:hydrogenase expression/formation protein HypE